MNKIIKTIPLLAVLALTGCKSGGSDSHKGEETGYFKEYTFVDVASSATVASIQDGITKSADYLAKVSRSNVDFRKAGSESYKVTSQSDTEFYDDSKNIDNFISISTGSSTSDATSNGITLKRSITNSTTVWDCNSGYILSSSSTDSNGNKSNAYSATTLGSTTHKTYKANTIKSAISLPVSSNPLTCYINNDGTYTFIYSSIVKQVSAVQWGDGTKEFVSIARNQIVYNVDKSYHVTKCYTYSEEQYNRDPVTLEWYDSVRATQYLYSESKFEYGTRRQKSISDLNASVSTVAFASSFTVYAHSAPATFNGETGSYVVNEEMASRTQITGVNIQTENDGSKTITFSSTIYGNSGNIAQGYSIDVSSIIGANAPTTKTYNIVFDEITDSSVIISNTSSRSYVVVAEYSTRYVRISLNFANGTLLTKSINIQ